MPRPPFTPRNDPVPIVQEAGWVPGPVWTGAENLASTGVWSPHRPARSQLLYPLRDPSQLLYPLSYPGPPNLPCSINFNESCICFFWNRTFTSSSDCPFVFTLLLNPLNPELNLICYLLALLGAHHFLHVGRIRVKLLTFSLLMSYIYGAPILDVSRSHTTTQHSR